MLYAGSDKIQNNLAVFGVTYAAVPKKTAAPGAGAAGKIFKPELLSG